jgi:hypothetical protein
VQVLSLERNRLTGPLPGFWGGQGCREMRCPALISHILQLLEGLSRLSSAVHADHAMLASFTSTESQLSMHVAQSFVLSQHQIAHTVRAGA